MNRREFLKMSLALTIGGLTMTADAAEIFSAKTIDFHAHAILPAYVDALKILKIDAARLRQKRRTRNQRGVRRTLSTLPEKICVRGDVALAERRSFNRRIFFRDGKTWSIGREGCKQFGRRLFGRRTIRPDFLRAQRKKFARDNSSEPRKIFAARRSRHGKSYGVV